MRDSLRKADMNNYCSSLCTYLKAAHQAIVLVKHCTTIACFLQSPKVNLANILLSGYCYLNDVPVESESEAHHSQLEMAKLA